MKSLILTVLAVSIGQAFSATCEYECKFDGSCQVSKVGGPIGSFASGSCFSRKFGGSCSGTPSGCQDCIGICEFKGTGRHTEPAGGSSNSGGSNSGGFGGSFGGSFGSNSGSSNSGSFGGSFGGNSGSSNSGSFGGSFGSNSGGSNSGGFGGSFGGSSSQTKTCFKRNSDGSTVRTKTILHNEGGRCRIESYIENCDRNGSCLALGKRRRRAVAEVSCDYQLTCD